MKFSVFDVPPLVPAPVGFDSVIVPCAAKSDAGWVAVSAAALLQEAGTQIDVQTERRTLSIPPRIGLWTCPQ